MNAIDDNNEPEDFEPRNLSREATRRKLAGASHVCMAAAFLALPMAIVDPKGWWLAAAVAGVALYLALHHRAANWRVPSESAP